MSSLQQQLCAAHAADDRRSLVALYTQAADQSADIDETCFFLTHAYVFALETGSPQHTQLRARLVAHGRESEADIAI